MKQDESGNDPSTDGAEGTAWPRGFDGLVDCLRTVYEAPGSDATSQPLRLTDLGVWLPTPFAALTSMLPLFASRRLWQDLPEPVTIFDAGAGDGRMLAYLAGIRQRLGHTGRNLRIYGMESDTDLLRVAHQRHDSLLSKGHPIGDGLLHGDYLDPESYEESSLNLESIDLFLNYPDGNEQTLANLLATSARPGTRLCFTTGEATFSVSGLTRRAVFEIPLEGAAPIGWHLSVYER